MIRIAFKSGSGDFPSGPVVKNPPCNAGDSGSIPGWGTTCCGTSKPKHHNYRVCAPQ